MLKQELNQVPGSVRLLEVGSAILFFREQIPFYKGLGRAVLCGSRNSSVGRV